MLDFRNFFQNSTHVWPASALVGEGETRQGVDSGASLAEEAIHLH